MVERAQKSCSGKRAGLGEIEMEDGEARRERRC